MIGINEAQLMAWEALSDVFQVEEIVSKALESGRGRNTQAVFLHEAHLQGGGQESVFHKVLEHEYRTIDTGVGTTTFLDPELVVASFSLENGPMPVPTPAVLALRGRHIFYRYLPLSKVQTNQKATWKLIEFAARINSYMEANPKAIDLPDYPFFACGNTSQNVIGLLDNTRIRSHFGDEQSRLAKQFYRRLDDNDIELPRRFSHGDLHAHNATVFDGEFIVFDWGSAGFYPVGFDLAETITHGRLLGNEAIETKEACQAYLGMMTGPRIELSDVLAGVQFAIVRWLLPNHLSNIRRFSRRRDFKSVIRRVNIARSCFSVARECMDLRG